MNAGAVGKGFGDQAMLREGESIELNYFLVAFLDVLGQREQLRRL